MAAFAISDQSLYHTRNAIKSACRASTVGSNVGSALANWPPEKKHDEFELQLQIRQRPALVAIKGWAAPEYGVTLERARQLNRERHNKYHLGNTVGLFGYCLLTAKLALANEWMALAKRENSPDYRMEANARACDVWFWLGRTDKAREFGLERIVSIQIAPLRFLSYTRPLHSSNGPTLASMPPNRPPAQPEPIAPSR